MSQDAHEEFLSSSAVGFCAKCGPQGALVLGESAFDEDPMSVHATRETTLQLAAIAILRPSATSALIDGNDQRSDAQELSAKKMMVHTIVRRIGQESIEVDTYRSVHNRRGELRGVVAGALADRSGDPEETPRVAKDGQLREMGDLKGFRMGELRLVMGADMPGLVSRGVHRALRFPVDQAADSGAVANSVEQSIETPFFRRRW
jgi:hypothetical protein